VKILVPKLRLGTHYSPKLALLWGPKQSFGEETVPKQSLGTSDSLLRRPIEIVIMLCGGIRRQRRRLPHASRKALVQGHTVAAASSVASGTDKAHFHVSPLRQRVRRVKDDVALLDMSANSHHSLQAPSSLLT